MDRHLDVVAAIDIGTNSVHMVVARRAAGVRFEVITRHKEIVRLGSGAGEMKELTAEAIDRGIAALLRCRQIAEHHEAHIVAVATSAVREAENRHDFLQRARDEAGIDVEVVSGVEEARLIHLGVLQALPVWDKTILLCDIGGGSTELLLGRGDEVLASRSFKLGAIRSSRRFFPDGVADGASVGAARRSIRDIVTPFAGELASSDIDVLVGSSGTIETVVTMALAQAGDVPRSVNAQVVTAEQVSAVVAQLCEAPSLAAIRKLKGVDGDRADILVAGALILDEVMCAVRAPSLTFSDSALREGVFLDTVRRHDPTHADHRLHDLRRESVLHLMELCEEDPAHAFAVARLADDLFVGLADELALDHEHRELLEAAALLSNVGLSISHSRHHHHSYYVIRNSEHLVGFTDRETELIAQVARYHRKSAPNERHEAFARLDAVDRELVRRLAALLRVAIGLDRSHRGLVEDVELTVDDDAVTIGIGPADVDLSLECYSATERRGLLETVSGRDVRIVPAH